MKLNEQLYATDVLLFSLQGKETQFTSKHFALHQKFPLFEKLLPPFAKTRRRFYTGAVMEDSKIRLLRRPMSPSSLWTSPILAKAGISSSCAKCQRITSQQRLSVLCIWKNWKRLNNCIWQMLEETEKRLQNRMMQGTWPLPFILRSYVMWQSKFMRLCRFWTLIKNKLSSWRFCQH